MSSFHNSPLKVHLIGVGGIGVSSLARWFLSQKWAVSGSDAASNQITRDLKKDGLIVKIGHKTANLPKDADLVIKSTAISDSNPEIRAARKLGLNILSYPEALGRLTKTYDTIAVSGSHGKSTTAALTSLALIAAKQDPTVIVGTKLTEFGDKNFRSGKSDWLVIEADEWRAAFLNYSPFISIVTTIDQEHLDFYKNLGRLKKTFLKFLERTREGGALVLNRDDKNLYSLRSEISGIAKARKLKIRWYSLNIRSDSRKIRAKLRIPGGHNVSNALAALTLARLLRIPEKIALRAISEYRGAWRRMEYRGRFWGLGFRCEVFDDYAHHPTEIKATLKAFKEKFPNQPLVCVYQPHQAKRLARLFEQFKTAFEEADITIILPVYEVAGRDKSSKKFNSQTLVKTIQKKQPKKLIFYLANPNNLKKAIRTLVISNSRHSHSFADWHYVVVMMGAGDIVNYTSLLFRK
ncbi:MAG: UDP-N-acetylmuramate--L-alanine ligase [Candidatus Liptonbacteria bacterium]|nr:UDP-N-acetylmuramate--L-alanine ligase [Candidatus Liptonbacteria bacterium]